MHIEIGVHLSSFILSLLYQITKLKILQWVLERNPMKRTKNKAP